MNGKRLLAGDGAPFVYRGITAMGLLALDPSEQEAWIADVTGIGFNVVRPLAMNHGWLDLPPEVGRARLPRLFELAGKYGAYVQIVALAGTKDRPRDFLDEQVKAVGVACAATDNSLEEAANEPFHASQHPALYSPKTMASLRALVPSKVLFTYGAPEKDEPLDSATQVEGFYTDGRFMSGGDYNVIHIDRRSDPWDRLRRFTEVAKVANATDNYTVDNEGKGYAEVPVTASGNARETRPEVAFAQGALARGFGLGSTFHCEAGLLCVPLGPVQRACAEAFIAGTKIVPDDVSFAYANAKAADSAVKNASLIGPSDSNAAMWRAFSFFAPGHNLVALVGLKVGSDPKIEWQNGWHAIGVLADEPPTQVDRGFKVLEIAK